MTAPVLPALGAATLNRKWIFEVNTATPSVPTWVVIGGLTNQTFNPDEANMVSDTDQAGQGYQSSTKTGATWSSALTLKRAPKGSDATAYDTGQEYLRTHAIGVFGPGNRVQLRISEYDPNDPNGLYSPRVEAYTGFAAVQWALQGGDMLAEDMVVATLQGQGKLTAITHPYPVTALVPTITAVQPSTGLAAAGGDLVTITGTGFTTTVSTTGVKIGGVNCPQWVVVADNEIVAKTPAHAAGSGVVVLVTNAAGPSVGGPTVTFV